MSSLFAKVLYFINGMTPTKEQIEDADNFGPGVAFRNAALIGPDHPIEQADAVAGPAIPDNYKAAIPHYDDREAVRKRMVARNPVLAEHFGVEPEAPPEETDADREARIQNALARGQKSSPINERNADAVPASARTTQSGDPRVTHPDDGWGTNPETINDAAARGQGVGATEGADVGAAPVGPQGAGGPGQRDVPKASPAGEGNPRRPGGKRGARH